jgi:hypothetical protein
MTNPLSSLSPDALDHHDIARHSFLYYLYRGFGLKPYDHIRAMVEEIERPVRHSAIVIPPGYGKSTIASQTYPTWYLGNHPERSVLLISNTDKQAKLFLHANQVTFEHHDFHQQVFPDVRPDPDRGWSIDGLFLKWKSEGSEEWQSRPATIKDPSLSAFGVGGPVIGRRADLIIVDDPYSQEMARSAVQRATFYDWFRTTLLSRLKPDPWCKILVIMTRWHPDDIVTHFQPLNTEALALAQGDVIRRLTV